MNQVGRSSHLTHTVSPSTPLTALYYYHSATIPIQTFALEEREANAVLYESKLLPCKPSCFVTYNEIVSRNILALNLRSPADNLGLVQQQQQWNCVAQWPGRAPFSVWIGPSHAYVLRHHVRLSLFRCPRARTQGPSPPFSSS